MINKKHSTLAIFLTFFPLSIFNQVINVATQDDFSKLLNDNKFVVVKFYTQWCGACKAIDEPFNELSQNVTLKDILFVSVDTDTIPSLKNKYNVTYIPFFVFFKDGQPVYQTLLESLNTFKSDMITNIEKLVSDDVFSDLQAEPSNECKSQKYLKTVYEFITLIITFIKNICAKIMSFVV